MKKKIDNNNEMRNEEKQIIVSSALVGKKLPTKDGGWLKIMAFCDNYYMARYKGCMPFCYNEEGLRARIEAHCL